MPTVASSEMTSFSTTSVTRSRVVERDVRPLRMVGRHGHDQPVERRRRASRRGERPSATSTHWSLLAITSTSSGSISDSAQQHGAGRALGDAVDRDDLAAGRDLAQATLERRRPRRCSRAARRRRSGRARTGRRLRDDDLDHRHAVDREQRLGQRRSRRRRSGCRGRPWGSRWSARGSVLHERTCRRRTAGSLTATTTASVSARKSARLARLELGRCRPARELGGRPSGRVPETTAVSSVATLVHVRAPRRRRRRSDFTATSTSASVRYSVGSKSPTNQPRIMSSSVMDVHAATARASHAREVLLVAR